MTARGVRYWPKKLKNILCLCLKMPEMSVAGLDNRPGLLGRQQAMPHALALYQQQITMAHESSQEAKQQQPQPTKSQHNTGGGDSSSPWVRTHSPGVSDRDREGKLVLIPRFIIFSSILSVHFPLQLSQPPLFSSVVSTAPIKQVLMCVSVHMWSEQ